MGTQTDYFNRIGYKPKYFIGDRVFGHWNKIPFIGTVGNDRLIGLSGPEITIHLDLQIIMIHTIDSMSIQLKENYYEMVYTTSKRYAFRVRNHYVRCKSLINKND
jgi:hypothetical protein